MNDFSLRPAEEILKPRIVSLRAIGTKSPLFCVHGGDGDIAEFRELSRALPIDQPVYGLAAPAMDGVGIAVSVERLAAAYIFEIVKLQNHGPYRLCGYSFGGLVAYEIAARLAEVGEDVSVVVLLDTTNYQYYRTMPVLQRLQFWMAWVRDRGKAYSKRIANRQFGAICHNVSYFAYKHLSLRIWQISRQVSRRSGRAPFETSSVNEKISKIAAHSYAPRSFPGRVIVFRPEERAAGYKI